MMERHEILTKLSRVLLLMLALLMVCSAALAETLDLSSYTMDELLVLRRQVDAAMLDLARTVDRSEATLDGLVWVSNGTEVRINAYTGTATEVVIPAEINGLPVTRLQPGVFRDCSHVTSVTLPDTITEIPDQAFLWCTKLTSVNIPASVTYIGKEAFNYCYELQTLTLPEGLTQLGNSAFYAAESLEGVVVLPSTLSVMKGHTFYRCDSLRGVVIQSNLALGQNDFNSESLEFVYIREGAAVSIKRNDVFHPNLRVLIIPASVTSIAAGAFEKCNNLTVVTPAGSYAEKYCRDNWIVCNTQDYDRYVAEYEALLAQ